MTHVVRQPEHHGQTYHLVARRPLLLRRMAQVIQEAVESYSTMADEDDATRCDGEWFQEAFKEQLEIYRPYWRDDPEFDYANTAAAAAHLPCPAVDGPMAMRLAKYAIQTNFGKRRRRLLKPEFDVHQHLQRLSRSGGPAAPKVNGNGRACLGLQVDGPGGGQWKLLLQQREPPGCPARHRATMHRNLPPGHRNLSTVEGLPSFGPRRRRGGTRGHRGQRHGAPPARVGSGSGRCRRRSGREPWSCRYPWPPLRSTCSRMTGRVIR